MKPPEGQLFPDAPPSHFERHEVIGRGGFGDVLRAVDLALNREVALKTLQLDLSSNTQFRSRFIAEAQATGQLEHPNIPPVHGLGFDHDGTPYFAMKLVRGETMAQVISRLQQGDEATHQRYSQYHRLLIISQVAEALRYAHAQGVLHLDVKPENIMMGPFGEVFLMDWGLSERLEESSDGDLLGTVGFCAPELLKKGDEKHVRMDVYGLGATAYSFLALRPAHPGKNLAEVVAHVIGHPVVAADTWIHPHQKRVSREVAVVLERALESNPKRRFQSMDEFHAALQAVLDGEAPVVCVQTGMKRGLMQLATFLDNYHKWAILAITAWTTFPLLLLVALAVALLNP
jgi:eukaryotic-like serine/threonine-protein kinase